jgi:uncharacterized protein YggE
MKSLHLTLVAVVAIVCALPLDAEESDRVRSIEVTGAAVVTQSPDQAEISFAVETQNESAIEANRVNADQTNRLIRALKKQGILGKDLQTSNYSISPRYRDRSRDDRDLKPIGYIVNNTVRVTVRKLSDVGSLIDKAVSAGATRVNRIRFELSDPAAARIQALKLAMKQAEHEARTLLSETPDNRLGKVLNIRTRGGHYAPKMERAVMSMARADTPIEGGTLGTRAEVTVSFEIVE